MCKCYSRPTIIITTTTITTITTRLPPEPLLLLPLLSFLYRLLCPYCLLPFNHPLNERSALSLDVALDGLRENSICTFAVCSARYKTRPGLVYHYGHSHSTSSGDPAKELSPSPAEVEPRSVADTAASNQPGWSQNQLSFLTIL